MNCQTPDLGTMTEAVHQQQGCSILGASEAL